MNLFFDSIIIAYLIATTTFGLSLWRGRKRPRTWEANHPRLATCVAVLLCCSAVVVVWGSFIEPRIITINRVSIDFPNFEPTKPVRVALISDIHVGTYKKDRWLRRISDRIIAEQPDLVLLAGDFIVDKKEHAKYLSVFSDLTARIPTYGVLGDHDYLVDKSKFTIDEDAGKTVGNALKAAGVKMLSNQTEVIEKNNATFILIGLDDWLAGKTDFKKALTGVLDSTPLRSNNKKSSSSIVEKPIVVLAHNPDFILDPESKKADLIIAGNTHGGQIRLPFIGPVPRLPSKLPRSFDKGLFDLQYTEALPPELRRQGLLFITSGISESGPRARLFNPPEIVLFSLF